MEYILGVDAGNSKTIALVARSDGTIVGAGRSGCGDIYGLVYHATSADDALAAVEGAVATALRSADIAPGDLAAGGFSMAGADWPEDYAFLRGEMERRRYGHTVIIANDAIGALRAGSPDGTGVVVACGSGAAIGARAADGRVWHGSFWQEVGGGQHLGHKTLRAVYRAHLGIDPPTALTEHVLRMFGQDTVADVLHLFTARLGTPPRDVDRLARVLLDTAAAGDAAARRIVREHGAILGDYGLAAARQAGIAEQVFPLVLAGGVFRHPSPLFPSAIVARVRATIPEVQPLVSRFEPVCGALFLALEAVGIPIDQPLRDRIDATMPPPALFSG